eukprot:GHVN01006039.1.p1 GENE.GHVN01006039.1~~GHVN01006039.1.p1  ORF type:complete len:351 (+),score=56.18 GHVN01006039.1:125-1177(+)
MAKLDAVDYYEILGVSKDATDGEIKRAYKALALKYHPDKNPDNRENAEHKFKIISEAYDAVATAEKREIYRRGGAGGDIGGFPHGFHFGHGHHFTGFDARELFASVFGSSNPFEIFERMGSGGSLGRMGHSGSMMGEDMLFGGGMGSFGGGGMGSMTSFSSSSFGGGGGGFSQSVSSSTRYINGKRVTTTERTVRKPDGTCETTVTEETDDGQGHRSSTTALESGEPHHHTDHRSEQIQPRVSSRQTRGYDPFNDPFFGEAFGGSDIFGDMGGMGGMGGMRNMHSMHSMRSMGGGGMGGREGVHSVYHQRHHPVVPNNQMPQQPRDPRQSRRSGPRHDGGGGGGGSRTMK